MVFRMQTAAKAVVTGRDGTAPRNRKRYSIRLADLRWKSSLRSILFQATSITLNYSYRAPTIGQCVITRTIDTCCCCCRLASFSRALIHTVSRRSSFISRRFWSSFAVTVLYRARFVVTRHRHLQEEKEKGKVHLQSSHTTRQAVPKRILPRHTTPRHGTARHV